MVVWTLVGVDSPSLEIDPRMSFVVVAEDVQQRLDDEAAGTGEVDEVISLEPE